jgi:hypothetical protein
MQYINKYILFFICSTIAIVNFSSCDEDTFSQVVDIEIPEHKSSIVLNGIWSSQDTFLSLIVSNSLSILDNEDYTVPNDAEVKLYKNEALLGDFAFDDFSRYFLELDDVLSDEVATYKIEASFGDYEPVSVEQTMPRNVTIENAHFEADGTFDPTGEKVDEFSITFNDPPGEENYYLFRVSYIEQFVDWNGDTIRSSGMIYLDSNDPIVNYSQEGLIFTDKAFDGNEYTINGWDYGWYDQVEEFELELVNLSKDGYLYLKSLEDYYNSEGNPFAQPATVYSNIENGYGIFALGAADRVIIEK